MFAPAAQQQQRLQQQLARLPLALVAAAAIASIALFGVFTNASQGFMPRALRNGVTVAQLMAHVELARQGCGEVCDTSKRGAPSLFVDHIEKAFDCRALMSNAAIDAGRVGGGGAQPMPLAMRPLYSYQGRVPVTFNNLMDQLYLGSSAPLVWTREQIDEQAKQCASGTLGGTYGRDDTANAYRGLREMPSVKGGHVLVIGSEFPWLEACAFAAGAREVTTLEYREITSLHPQLHTMTPAQARADFLSGKLPQFDAVATFSSLEHSGLGRYGDALNPFGDLQATARAWCMTRPGGEFAIGIPSGPDEIVWNLHRVYGPVMTPHLIANWQQVWHGRGVQKEGRQDVFVVRKVGGAAAAAA